MCCRVCPVLSVCCKSDVGSYHAACDTTPVHRWHGKLRPHRTAKTMSFRPMTETFGIQQMHKETCLSGQVCAAASAVEVTTFTELRLSASAGPSFPWPFPVDPGPRNLSHHAVLKEHPEAVRSAVSCVGSLQLWAQSRQGLGIHVFLTNMFCPGL